MNLAEALAALKQLGGVDRATGLAEHYKMPRQYLGIPNGVLNDLAQHWRQQMSLEARLALATELWLSLIHI